MSKRRTSGRISVEIVVALIALVGVITAAVIQNWDKLFPRPPVATPAPVVSVLRIEAEKYDVESAHVERNGFVSFIDNDEWLRYDNVDFGSGGLNTFTTRVASGETGGTIEVRLDKPGGQVVAICEGQGTGGWDKWVTISCPITSGLSGERNVHLVFQGTGTYIFNIDWFEFGP